ncbi:HAD-IIIA family hydrolase [Selenomonas ruminantium]|uniref:HAD-IIIA family hydrolase n=1 Tax=Selenomonas ruminantium TaxID=971 RepID=UPI00047D1421|nr:HAD-IIIA family hydrolase [Selenomonas ruminantium]
MKTVIMAGGRGTRIADYSKKLTGKVLPKPMIPIDDVPVLEWEINSLRDQGFTKFILTISYLAEEIMDYFGDGSGVSPVTGKPFGVQIEYFHEHEPLGNAGALYKLRDRLVDEADGSEDFLLLNADSIFDLDFQRLVVYHRAKGGKATLFTHPNSHPYDSGLIIAAEDGGVEKWLTKEDVRPEYYKNRVNAGVHVLNVAALDEVAKVSGIEVSQIGRVQKDGKIYKVDLDRQILKPLCGRNAAGGYNVYCYDSPEYVKDMGTPERFEAVAKDFKAGIVQAKNLSHKQKAIFLDRDGTLNKYVGFLRKTDELELLSGVAEAIQKINASGYLAIVITNQPVVARGEVTFEGLEEIHRKLETELGKEGAYIDALYYCPHHPDKGFAGEVPELKKDCTCRKPKPGMILQAAKDYNIDLASSWMVGDSEADIACGKNAGVHTVLLSRETTDDYGQEVTVDNLLDFVEEHMEA